MVCFLLDSEAIAAWLDPDQSYEAVSDLLRPVPEAADLLIAERGIEAVHPPSDGIDGHSLFG